MPTENLKVRQVRDLLRHLAFPKNSEAGESGVIVSLPEYLPPVLVQEGAELSIARATACLRECRKKGDHLLITAHYEDRREPSDCCVVFSAQLNRSSGDEFVAETGWLAEFAEIRDRLLEDSVELRLRSTARSLTFDLKLPVYRPGCVPFRHRNRILLVEDDPFVRRSSAEVLETAGHEVVDCANAEQALAIFDREGLSLSAVLSDVTLPGRDGKELASLLHAQNPKLPVLLMSGYHAVIQENVPNRIFALAKPYNSRALLNAVQRCLSAHHSANEGSGRVFAAAGAGY